MLSCPRLVPGLFQDLFRFFYDYNLNYYGGCSGLSAVRPWRYLLQSLPQFRIFAVYPLPIMRAWAVFSLFILFFIPLSGQQNLPAHFTHHTIVYKKDTVHILLYQKPGDENKIKPLFLFMQGSLPIPLVVTESGYQYSIFPFNPDSLASQYHLAMVGKPGLPLQADASELAPNLTYVDSLTQQPPFHFSQNDYPAYYVGREQKVIEYFQKKSFIANDQLVLAGHSAGATLAVGLAKKCKKVTGLIYACGNPYGRIVTVVASARKIETDSTQYAHGEFDYWRDLVKHPTDTSSLHGNTNQTMFAYSVPVYNDLLNLKIPVLVVYASKDVSSPYSDLLQIEAIRKRKKNMYFNCYMGREHNFFKLHKNGSVNYEDAAWDQVGGDWNRWLLKTQPSHD
jgi:dienelactone hydrolase